MPRNFLIIAVVVGCMLNGCAHAPPMPCREYSIYDIQLSERPPSLNDFVAAWQDKVFADWMKIYDQPGGDENHRFIIVSASGGNQHYVQCMLHDNDTFIYCEAASGFFGPRHGPHFSQAASKILANEGFSTDDSNGNFSFDRPMTGVQTLHDISGTMLRTLYGIYSPLGSVFKVCTPYRPDV